MSETGTGALIDGRYRLGEILGSGGMSRVWRAEDEALGREVAIKILREPLVQHTERFEREARTMGRLRHPSVVKVYGYGMTRGEEPGSVLPYLVLELVDDAISLYRFIEERGALAADETARLMRPIAGALAEAHAHGIVHRDLKPENILIQYAPGIDPQPRLLDFGIAAWDEPDAQRLTQTGQIFGTPAYMAPEHATGQFGAGPTADVWSLGVMLHELVSGECPFRGPHVTATLFNITNKPAPPLEGVPDAFAALVDDCLIKDHEARLPDAAAVLDRLTALVETLAESAPEMRPVIGTDPTLGMGLPLDAEDEDGQSGERAAAPPSPSLGPDRLPRDLRHSMETVALDRAPEGRRWGPVAIAGLAGLLLGLALGWSRGEPVAPLDKVADGAEPARVVATGPAPATGPDAGTAALAAPADAGRPSRPVRAPLVDEALAPAVTFLDGGDPGRAVDWLEANPDAGHEDARDRLYGLIALARDRVKDGLELLDPLLTRRPDLARDVEVQAALVGHIDARNAGGLVDMLGVMLEAAPALEEQLLEMTDHDDYRTRRRAVRIIEQAGHDIEAARFRYYVRNLRLLDCDLRRHAVERLRHLGNPGAIGPIKRMDERTGFFDNLCMDDAVERTLGTLYAAERRQIRARKAAARAGGEGSKDAADTGLDDAGDAGDPGADAAADPPPG